ncbi:ABC transporter ATP-binding protein [Clavibacter californiensis]|uniref:ABC transporter ATP-binding protein n=1 Tax=Clavibacter californiensis TaxID=1401995 RepID=A0ABX9N171_9MICO|nr:ABC transporter ATP-binding protein [Clavibacter californiensis]RII87468.1 ABC transporter ATP-binding protein [Clavibacter californiensis]UKF78824.1 ABC transporter ATP-binding protein [Clavibacter californiensis]
MTTAAVEEHVSVRDLEKTYGTTTALRGVSFDIHRGETFALLGPNGAGKSTTIEILEGYRLRTGGSATVLGVDPATGGRAWRARIGMVLQSSSESGAMTVREQVAHFAAMYPRPRDVDATIEAVGLTEKAGTLLRALSGGQRRRVDVALGIIGRPELLFLDEPTTGFDPEARHRFWDLIRELKAEGTTILLTTHYLDEAAQLGDRAAVIAGGRLVAIGRLDEIGGEQARIPRVLWHDDDGSHDERTRTPGAFVSRLSEATPGGEPRDLRIVRPSLEDVYLGLLAEAGAPGATTPSAAPATTAEVAA